MPQCPKYSGTISLTESSQVTPEWHLQPAPSPLPVRKPADRTPRSLIIYRIVFVGSVQPLPPDPFENTRLEALAEYGLAPDSAQAEVRGLLELARSLFKAPTVLLSLVERHRQIFAARVGLDVCETDRSVSFCAYALQQQDILFVPDARLDDRFSDNALVTGDPFIRFYAGHPLRAPSGQVIGTLCLISPEPRPDFSSEDRRNLASLAELVLDKMEVLRLQRAQRHSQVRFEQISATSPDAIICADDQGLVTFWNAAAEKLFGHTAQAALGRSIDLIVPERMQGGHGGGLTRVAKGGAPRLIGKTIELPARHRDGSEFPVELSLSMWREDDRVSFGSIMRDISERRANEERLHRLAHLDPLTGLANRMVLRERLEAITQADPTAAVLVIDLDGFKAVNDTLGHSAGDAVLVEVATRLVACVTSDATVARLGGDEFAIVLPALNDPLAVSDNADIIIESLTKPFMLEGRDIFLGASVGIALCPLHGSDAEDLLSAADLALYAAKREPEHGRRFFEPGLRQAAVLKQAQDIELRRAVERGEFELFYQAQVRATDGALVGAEALLRWRHPARGLQSPASFMSALETGVLAADVGTWVLRTACRQAAAWRQEGLCPDFRIGVNLFGAQFRSGDLAQTVRRVLTETCLPPDALELEITENIILRHDDAMIRPLSELREIGVGIAFDDYGTGYASLSLLKRYPLSRLKIDQSFVRSMCDSPRDAAIIRAVTQLGKAFKLDVIAEGVENEAQRARLLRKGCDELQGFLFGRPLSATEFEQRHLEPPQASGEAA